MRAREAFEEACEGVAEYYLENGWKYLKSKHILKYAIEDVEFRIYFYSSVKNISDISVDFYGECAIYSKKGNFKYFTIDNYAYGIPKEKKGLWWNVADETERKKAVKEFLEWSRSVIVPMVTSYREDKDQFVHRVAQEGFTPELDEYRTDVGFVLTYGGMELAQIAAQKYYKSLEDSVKANFKSNYLSMIEGGQAVSKYGSNMVLNRSNFKIIIENKIVIQL